VLCPKHKVEMRLIRFPRGKMRDTCYPCERESIDEDEETVLKRLLERDRKDGPEMKRWNFRPGHLHNRYSPADSLLSDTDIHVALVRQFTRANLRAALLPFGSEI
jgi:hypothetical protein